MTDIKTNTLYVTDYGSIEIPAERLKARHDDIVRQFWWKHRDDLVGLPDTDWDNSALHEAVVGHAKRLWDQGENPEEYPMWAGLQ